MLETDMLFGGLTVGNSSPTPPSTRQDNVEETLHGVELVDRYRWLEDQHSEETREWIRQQNEHTDAILNRFSGGERLAERIAQLTKADHLTAPSIRNGRYFCFRRRADEELFVFLMREGFDGQDQVLLDPHTMSEDLSVNVALLDISDDGRLVVYGLRHGGEDELMVRILDVDRRQDLPDMLDRGLYFGCSLLPDNRTLYYARHGEDGPRAFRRVLGTGCAEDECVFGEAYGPNETVDVSVSEDGRWLLFHVWYGSAGSRTEIYIKDLKKDGPIVPVVNDLDARSFGTAVEDKLYILTDWNAPNQRLMVADPCEPRPENWRELVPEREAALRNFSLAGGMLFLDYLESVISRIDICDADGRRLRQIRFPAIGTVGDVSGRWRDDEAFFTFNSYNVPWTIYRYRVSTGEQTVWSRLSVPFEGERFEVKQVWFTSKDGAKVPMFVSHKKGLKLDGSAPALLTGYGGFNISSLPGFSAMAAVWIERGGVYAAPNLRGGGEFGEGWHESGMFDRKQNVFDDFIAAAEYLIENGYTRPSRLAIAGGSNGGLLVGAVLTQRPELFNAVACSYPLLDMIRYHKFLRAPLWVSEYGSSDDPEQFKYLLAYSPYHNVKAGVEYPAVLFITGDSDTRVDPLHARKMCALLQASTGSDRPVLLYYDTQLGHAGGRPVNKQIEDLGVELGFLLAMSAE